ncbi:hypothetical protein OG357_25325 [Streptomyces sp. NBC_01255]|uniref:hypothetical protein n=1 Tax=Streptomyces sp. NBC_01255 TaxID=2903798 RepID=UPI002E321D5B|nr:hypothetical protein [Streptomyces sp. NBC_01255]
MARVEEGKPYGWGRLHAAFQVLEGLAAGRTELGKPSKLRETTDTPRNTFIKLLGAMGLHLLLAREKGGRHAEAAEAVVGDMVRLIAPERMSRNNLDPREVAEFRQGYDHQIGLYREKWGDLVV